MEAATGGGGREGAGAGQGGAGRGAGDGHAGVTLRRVTCGVGSHGGKRTAQRRRHPSASPQRLGPPGGCLPQRLEELLAVGGQGEGGSEVLPGGGGRGGQLANAAAGERRPPPAEDRGQGREGRSPGRPLGAAAAVGGEPPWARPVSGPVPAAIPGSVITWGQQLSRNALALTRGAPQLGRRSPRNSPAGCALASSQVTLRSSTPKTGLGTGAP